MDLYRHGFPAEGKTERKDFEMKAAYIDEFGGPEAIRFGEMPKPAPRANEVLVRNQIIGIGKPDALVRSGNDPYLASKFPGLIIGNESAGIVEAVFLYT